MIFQLNIISFYEIGKLTSIKSPQNLPTLKLLSLPNIVTKTFGKC